MVVRPWFSICLCAAAAVSISFLQADEAPKAVETVEVKLKDLVLNLPKDWQSHG